MFAVLEYAKIKTRTREIPPITKIGRITKKYAGGFRDISLVIDESLMLPPKD